MRTRVCKTLSLALSAGMLMTALAGCAASSPAVSESAGSAAPQAAEETAEAVIAEASEGALAETKPGVDFDADPYTVNYLYLVAAEGTDQAAVNAAVDELAMKELNMHVNLIPMTYGAYMTQLNMMLAANEDLDIFPAMSFQFANFIESQYIVNCADYLDYMPDVKAVLGEDSDAGYIGDFLVGFSQMKERGYQAGLVVRKDIFDELGYSVDDFNITTEDYSSFSQLTDLFAAVKEAYPDMTVLDGQTTMGTLDQSYVDNLGNSFGVLEDYGRGTTVTNWYESEQFKNFCKITREWFEKGYESADIAVNTDTGSIKLKAGNTFSFITSVKPNTTQEIQSQTGYEVAVIPMAETVMKSTSAVSSALFCIANSAKDKEKAAAFMNWTYTSKEFNDLINWGIEGIDWIETENGLAAYPEGVNASSVGYHNDFGFMYPNQFIGHAWEGNLPNVWDLYAEYNGSLEKSAAFGFSFDSVPVATELAQLTAVQDQYRPDIALGVVDPEEILSEFNAALYAAGLQTVIDEKQRQLDEWLAKQ